MEIIPFYKLAVASLFLTYSIVSHAQEQSLRPVKIGEEVPDRVFEDIVNGPKMPLRLSDLRGKVVILDFWTTGCASCIAAMPRMEALQRRFRDSIQIILVNPWEKREKIEERLSKMMKDYVPGKGLSSLPSAYGDTVWRVLFPHKMVPHEVWISPEGKLLYTTAGTEVNERNIGNVLKGNRPTLWSKVDQIQFDRSRPIFENGNLKDLKPLMAKVGFSHYIPGLPGAAGNEVDTALGTKRLYFTYSTVEQLYQRAAAFLFNPDNRTIWRVNDMKNYIEPAVYDRGWEEKNKYCIEVTLPLHAGAGDWAYYFLQTINTNLRLNGHFKKISSTCYEIVPQKGRDSTVLSTKGGIRSMSVSQHEQEYIYKNMPVDIVMYSLNHKNGPIIINWTGVKGHVDLRFPKKENPTIDELKTCLQKQGLDLVKAVRDLDFLVIDVPNCADSG